MAAASLRRAHVPYVVSPNGTALRIERHRGAKLAFDSVLGRGLLPHAARVLAVTEAERRQLHRAGIQDGRIRMVPNPLDMSEFLNGGDAGRFRRTWGVREPRIVLYLGKITPRKGVDVLVRALPHVKTPDVRLIIAGNDMGAGSAVSRTITRTCTDARITRTGVLRGADRLDALAAADVVVYPSRDEIFGLVPLEALLCGRPVVVCDDSGCGEIIGEIGGGCIVPYGDERALASAIDAVLDDRSAWRMRAQSAAASVRRAFDADVVCARLQRVYEEVCA
jgi:glycosyltransferase involved in cell wall biosynthesis